jgi:Septum formation
MRVAGLGTLLVAAVLVAAASGCGAQEYRMSKVGECLPSSAQVVGVREPAPPLVPCGEPHRYEVYAVTQLDLGGAWPGESTVDEAANGACQDALASGAGIDRNDPPAGFKILRIQPTENSWSQHLDRTVECLLRLPTDHRGQVIRPGSLPPETTTTVTTTTVTTASGVTAG